MKRGLQIQWFLLFNALLQTFITGAQGLIPPGDASGSIGIEVTHNQFYCPGASLDIVESVTITDPENPTGSLNEVFIQISEGYVQGEDVLYYIPDITLPIESSWSPNEGLLTLSGTATFEQYEQAIKSVVFETAQSIYVSNRSVSINLGTASYLPSTGHYYRYVSSPGISWDAARDAAAQDSYFGLQGYLVTITSQEEGQLAGEQSPGTGWIGGSDAQTEGIWRWVTGPEENTIFWEGGANGVSPSGQYAFWNCGEPNDFGGNEDYAHITDNSVAGCGGAVNPSLFGSWNDLPVDSGGADPSNPYYPKGYIIEYGGFPNDPEIYLSASSVLVMPQMDVEELEVCGSGTYELGVTGNADSYYWYDSENAVTAFHIGSTYTAALSSDVTYWILPVFGGCEEGVKSPFHITVNPIPQATSQSVTQCDSEGDSDGITMFNLSIYDESITGSDLVNKQLNYYEDENLTIEIDKNAYTNQFNGQVVYALVTQTISGCVSIAEIELWVTTPNSNSAYLEVCDDLPEDGFALFDLSLADDQVIADPSTGLSTIYYETYEDALLQVDPLPLNYRNTIADYQIIYVRLQEGNSCFGINEVELVVNPLPQLRPDETVYYCLNTYPESILIDGGIINDTPNNYYYNWSTGETTIAIEVNEPGTYTVEVSEVLGCTNLRTITVLPSETATIENVNIETTGERNTLVVQVSGSGEYEYSLDSAFGPYQNSNTFEGVGPGVRTVYVRDVKGYCGMTSRDISILGYPKFFTPNNDGLNDRWAVKGFNSRIPFKGVVWIYDRNGKQLAELTESNSSWDGRYNGKELPASDYWFIAELENSERYTGHFTLKR